MTVTKTNKLQVKTSCGIKTLEILKINKAGINARDVNQSAFPVTLTGYEFFGIQFFWEGVKSGRIAII